VVFRGCWNKEYREDGGSMLREKIESTKVPEKAKDVEILEVDELFSYCQKKLPECTYGLLLIGTEMKLLISK